jgi:hypothetical protein
MPVDKMGIMPTKVGVGIDSCIDASLVSRRQLDGAVALGFLVEGMFYEMQIIGKNLEEFPKSDKYRVDIYSFRMEGDARSSIFPQDSEESIFSNPECREISKIVLDKKVLYESMTGFVLKH